MNPLELEREIEKMARAMMTRNAAIGNDLIAHLRTKLTLEGLAGITIVSIERLISFDIDSVSWTIQNLIPVDVMQEIQKIFSLAVCKRLIGKGFMPGKDFSVNAAGQLLFNEKARSTVAR